MLFHTYEDINLKICLLYVESKISTVPTLDTENVVKEVIK
jgi:hypothetical protein